MKITVTASKLTGATQDQFITSLTEAVEDLNEAVTDYQATLPADQQAAFNAKARAVITA